ncbi:uncharacterized protein LOC115033186 [Acyrthosiphon pisum]|uniref:Uncharacterized protein n=1 Tax=Acyrthosiphon pisum TaxID=7029 RepID=A0A8R2NLB2_ACYPI|nr:uncharacterized protein LOC115033186 [Acyrthosiphon pisum]
MNNQELDQDNNKNKEPQISIELDDSVIKAPLSTFNNTMECLTTERILKKQNNEKNIIGLHDLEQIECFKKKYELFGTQFKALESIETKLERNLKRNKFAQPKRCHLFSCRQQSKLSTIVKM